MSNIILVGTLHNDLKGPERLEKLLQYHKPEIICLEATPKSATDAWKSYLEITKRLNNTPLHLIYSPDQIKKARLKLMNSSYEIWVPKIYKNGSPNIKLFCIDKEDENDDELSRLYERKQREWIENQLRKGKRIEDLLTHGEVDLEEFIRSGSLEEHQAHLDNIYDTNKADEFISKYGEMLFKAIISNRDKRFAEQIRKIHVDEPNKTVVAILGVGHFFENYNGNTYNLLSDLNPERIKLKEADRI